MIQVSQGQREESRDVSAWSADKTRLTTSFLKLDRVVKRFGTLAVVNDVSLVAGKGEFIVFVGPSGCGKSTLLRMIAGLEDISEGDVSIDGRVVTRVAPADREVSMVFQSYALYGLDVEGFLPTIHGMRAIETMQRLELPGLDLAEEVRAVERAEMEDLEGVEAIAGITAFLHSLPADRWTIVTSASRELAARRLAAAGLLVPPLLVSCDDVRSGKPAPDGFLLAAERLGQPIEACLVFEDSAAGIQAAEAAGAAVVVINATHRDPMETPHPSIAGFETLQVKLAADGGLDIVIAPAANT